MGKQYNKFEKRQRRISYLKRKKETGKGKAAAKAAPEAVAAPAEPPPA